MRRDGLASPARLLIIEGGEEEFGYLTAEARSAPRKEFLIKKYSELCDLCASVVK